MRFTVSLLFIINTLFVFGKSDDAFIKLDLPTFESDGVFSTTSRPPNDWWEELNDPILDSLINLAVSNNQDVFVNKLTILKNCYTDVSIHIVYYSTIFLADCKANFSEIINFSERSETISCSKSFSPSGNLSKTTLISSLIFLVYKNNCRATARQLFYIF